MKTSLLALTLAAGLAGLTACSGAAESAPAPTVTITAPAATVTVTSAPEMTPTVTVTKAAAPPVRVERKVEPRKVPNDGRARNAQGEILKPNKRELCAWKIDVDKRMRALKTKRYGLEQRLDKAQNRPGIGDHTAVIGELKADINAVQARIDGMEPEQQTASVSCREVH